VTDNPKPGATSGPFVVKLVSEDLKSSAREERTFSKFTYTAKVGGGDDMEKYISKQAAKLMRGIDHDDWDAFEKA